MKPANGYEIVQLFEQFAPKKYALEGDKIGLQVGRLNKPVEKVLVTLDVTEAVVDEAVEKEVQLIIAHHPPIYRPLQKIDMETAAGRILEKLIKHDIAVYAAHTNLDVARGGVNDLLAEALGLTNTEVLVPTYEEPLKKLVVFVPEENAKEVKQAIGDAGAGAIGEYTHCAFSAAGIGQFLPGEGTNPYIGQQGKLEEVREIRVETIVPESIEKKVISAMLKAHPYEEVAYDLYPLENKNEPLGLGRIGEVPKMSLKEFAEHVKKALDIPAVRVVGDLNAEISKVALLGGDGNKYFMSAKFKGADVYVTGDIYYHTAHDALMVGLNMIDPGHYAEKVMKKGVVRVMSGLCREKNLAVSFLESEVDTNPFQFV